MSLNITRSLKKHKLKILQINASYKPAYIYGGPTMSVSKLSEELVKSGINVEVFTTTANGQTELNLTAGSKKRVDDVPVTYFGRLTKDPTHFSPALLFFLWKTLRKDSSKKNHVSNIVHIHAWWNFVSVGSCLIALFLSKPVILSPRGTLSSYSFGNRKSFIKNIFHQTIGKALLKRSNFHVSTEKEKQDIIKLLEPKTITVIPNFVELPLLKNYPLPSRSKDESPVFKLLFLSRIEEKKGLDILLKALPLVKHRWQLTIAGTGNPEYILYLKSLALKLNLTHKINWIGQVQNEEKFEILSDHDLMILPSHDESFANVVIESLYVGTAVLLSSNVGLSGYVNSANLGWIYNIADLNLAATINQALENRDKIEVIKVKGPLYIDRDFNDQSILKQYLKLYQNVGLKNNSETRDLLLMGHINPF